MDGYTFFKTPEGNLYGVSERVMSSGYVPKEGVVLATNDEIDEANQRVIDAKPISKITDDERNELVKKMIESNVSAEIIKTVTGIGEGI